jgi:SAM-dependent methyltransferase
MMVSSQFPQLYHAHHNAHMEDLPFWLGLAARQGDPILELGCGTGRLLLPVARAGYRVYGLDNDASMLAVLKGHLADGLRPLATIWQADMAAFRLAIRFSLILLPCNTFSTLPADACRRTLANAFTHLRPGGLFAASLPNPTLLARLPAQPDPEVEEIFSHPLDGEPVQVSSAWQRNGGWFELDWFYDHLLPDGQVERTRVTVRHRLDSPGSYLKMIEEAGLTLESRYGDFDFSPYKPGSPNLILIAARPG